MNLTVAVVVLASIAALNPSVSQTADPAACAVTRPPILAFVPPAPYPIEPSEGTFWFGTAAFWTRLEVDGRWGVGDENHLSTKVFWWRPGFNGAVENFPDLTVSLKRVDQQSLPITVTTKATNASDESFAGSVMSTGISVPAPGCWEVIGHHRGHEVRFVVEVTP
jgi:hypothetical protein